MTRRGARRWPARTTSPTARSRRPSSWPSTLEQPLLLEGEAGVGKTEVAKALAGATRRAADPAAVPRGHRPPPRALRLGLRRASCWRSGPPRPGREARELFAPRVPAAPAAARGARVRRAADRAADRRDRPRRRRVRGLPARVPVGLPGHDPRAGDGRRTRAGRSSSSPRTAPASCTTRSSAAACTTGSTTRRRSASAEIVARPRCPGVPEAVAGRVCDAVARLRAARSSTSCPGVGETIAWARALIALGEDGSLDDTLGAALKVREDVDRVRGVRDARGCLRRPPSATGWASSPPASRALGVRRRRRGGARRPSRPRRDRRRRRGEECYLALRAVMCGRRTDLAAFDAAFSATFRARGARPSGIPPELMEAAKSVLPRTGCPPRCHRRPAAAPTIPGARPAAYSDVELLLAQGLRALHRRGARRRAAAARAARARAAPSGSRGAPGPTRRRHEVHDVRATLRASLRHGGELVERR